MAERGAHLTTTLQPKPSIFEVVASDSLNQTFQPAILRLCNVSQSKCYSLIKPLVIISLHQSLASVNPEKYGWLVRYYDELYLLLNSTVQQYYIRTQGKKYTRAY